MRSWEKSWVRWEFRGIPRFPTFRFLKMRKLGISGKAGNVLHRYRKVGKAWELVPGKAGKPIISKTPAEEHSTIGNVSVHL